MVVGLPLLDYLASSMRLMVLPFCSVDFRVRDRNEPGSQPAGPDTYQIITVAFTSGLEDSPL
jgi:hypothetical protein